MRKQIIFLEVVLLFIALFQACNINIPPAVSGIGKGKKYDTAAFDYVYVEALRQKLLGNVGEALKYLEQCVKMNPENDAVYYQMAQILFNTGDIKNGKINIKKAVLLQPDNLWYQIMLAGLYYQEKKIDSVIYCYENVVKNYPDRVDLLITLGNLYSESKKYDKADRIFNALDDKYGVNEKSTLENVKNLNSAGRYDDALKLIDKLLVETPDDIMYNGIKAEIFREKGDNDKAMEVYNMLIERNPENPETQLSLCDFLLSEKKYAELMHLINTVNLNENVSREDKIGLYAKILEDNELLKEKNDEVLLSIMVLEAAYENDGIISLLRPEFYQKTGRLKDSSARLEEIIALMPDNYFAWEKLLLIYLEEKDYKNLEKRAEQCALKFNRSFLAKMLYAAGATENKKFDIALEELRKAEILAGDNKEMLQQVMSTKADIYYRMKDYEKAFGIFDEALKSGNNDMIILNNYAYYLAERDLRLKDAEKMAKMVIDKEKDNYTFLDTYAWVLYKRGKLREAEKIMEEIIKKSKVPDAEYYEHLGYIKRKRKNCIEAVKYWKKAIEIDSTKVELIKEIEKCQVKN